MAVGWRAVLVCTPVSCSSSSKVYAAVFVPTNSTAKLSLVGDFACKFFGRLILLWPTIDALGMPTCKLPLVKAFLMAVARAWHLCLSPSA